MIAIEKMNRGRSLIAAVSVLALVLCVCVVAMPSDVNGDVAIADGTTGPIMSYQIEGQDPVDVEASGIVEAMTAINGATSNVTVDVLQDFSLDLSSVTATTAGLWFVNSNSGVTVTINGNGHTISVADGTYANGVNAIGFGAGTSIVSDLSVDGRNIAHHGINIYGADTNVTLTDVSSDNNYATGVTVNLATVTAEGLTATGNGWGAVNVDNSGNFTLKEGDNDLGTGFQIWSEGNSSTITAEGYETYGWGKNQDATGSILIKDGTITGDFVLPASDYISIPEGKTLTVAEGAEALIDGYLTIVGSLENNGNVEIVGTVSMKSLDQISGNGTMIASPEKIKVSGTTDAPAEDDFGVVIASKNIYNGTAQEPNLRVVGPSNVTDVSVYDDTITAETEVGTYSATVSVSFSYTLTGDNSQSFTGRITFDFQWSIFACELTADNIADIPIQGITEQNPGPFTPELEITNNGITLQEGVDYTVAYENNTGAGTGIAIVTGIGNYTGTVEKAFYIIDYQDYVNDLEQFIGGDQGLGKEVPGAEPMTYAQIPAINDAITAAYNALYSATDPDTLDETMDDAKMDIVVATKNVIKDFLATVYNNGQGYMGWMMTTGQYNAALEAIGPDGTYLPADTIRVYEVALESRTECYSITYMVGDNLYLYQGGELGDFKAIVGCTVVPEGMTFVAWNVAGTDIFYMPGDMIELGVDTNMWGDNRTIVLEAVYSGGSDTPEEPTLEPSANIHVSITYADNGVTVYLFGLDGGYIPAGEITVEYTYTYYDDFFGAYATDSIELSITIEESDSNVSVTFVDLSAEEHFMDITYAQAFYGDFVSAEIVYAPISA